MYLAVPFHLDATGRTAASTRRQYVRDLIELTLFTEPGERVDRPDFGCGLQRLVFSVEGNHSAAVRSFVRGTLQSALHGVIDIHDVQVEFVDSIVSVVVGFVDPTNGETDTLQVRRAL